MRPEPLALLQQPKSHTWHLLALSPFHSPLSTMQTHPCTLCIYKNWYCSRVGTTALISGPCSPPISAYLASIFASPPLAKNRCVAFSYAHSGVLPESVGF